jgi:hypothetical protein
VSELLQRQVIDEIIFAVDSRALPNSKIRFSCATKKASAHTWPSTSSACEQRRYLERIGPAPLLTFAAAPDDEIRLMIKRFIDIARCLALVIVAPFMLRSRC